MAGGRRSIVTSMHAIGATAIMVLVEGLLGLKMVPLPQGCAIPAGLGTLTRERGRSSWGVQVRGRAVALPVVLPLRSLSPYLPL